jgi:predicted RNase H-like nuclease (RuvC/YqgF family)
MKSRPSSPHAGDFNFESRLDSIGFRTQGAAGQESQRKLRQELAVEVDHLREKLGLAIGARLAAERALGEVKQELIQSEKRSAECGKTNLKQTKELQDKSATIERLEQHVSRLQAQISEKDAIHAEMVRSQADLTNALHSQTAELKKTKEECLSLREADLKVDSLEKEVSLLRLTIGSLEAELKGLREHCIFKQSCLSGSSDHYDYLGQPPFTKENSELRSGHAISELTLEADLDEACGYTKGSFLDLTDYNLPIQLSDHSIDPFEIIDNSREDRGSKTRLKATISTLERKLDCTTAYWSNENRILQEYIDELKQLLSHLTQFRPASSTQPLIKGIHKVRDSVYQKVKGWLRYN